MVDRERRGCSSERHERGPAAPGPPASSRCLRRARLRAARRRRRRARASASTRVRGRGLIGRASLAVATLPDRHGRPQGPRVHLLADRPHLPAQPGRAGRLQRRQVRRRLLADPRGGAAAQARVRRRADRDRARAARARPRLRLGAAARLRPRAGRRRGRRDALLGAGRGLPAPRPRRPPRTTRGRSTRETLRPVRRGREPRRLRALLLARGATRPGARTRSTATSSRNIASVLPDRRAASTCRRWCSGAT